MIFQLIAIFQPEWIFFCILMHIIVMIQSEKVFPFKCDTAIAVY